MRSVAIASEFEFPLDDCPGALASLTGRLRAADVNMLTIRARPQREGGARVGCVPESADQFRNFAESASLDADESPVVWVEGIDETGALRHVLEQVASAGVNVKAIEAISFAGRYGAVLRVAPGDWPTVLSIVRGSDD